MRSRSELASVSEYQIEDILASYPDDTKKILGLSQDISLISRQKILPSGKKLDMLFLSAHHLILLELKVVKCEIAFCNQTQGYVRELTELQKLEKLPELPIQAYLACTDFSNPILSHCKDNEIIPVRYSPFDVLETYYHKAKAITRFVNLKPANLGLWRLGLLNRVLESIPQNTSLKNLSQSTGLAKSTLSSYIQLSSELGLSVREPSIQLTEMGVKFVRFADESSNDLITEDQSQIMRTFISKNPFYDRASYGIYCAVESVFVLSRSSYPVMLDDAVSFFKIVTGRKSEWNRKAGVDAFKMYSNYAIELGLLAKMGKKYYITPAGIKFILLLELNKSIELVNSL